MEAALVARGHIRAFTRQPRRARQREAMTTMTSLSDEMSRRQFREHAPVRKENLGQQEIKFPKATEIGVARETSARFIAANNNKEILISRLSEEDNRGVNTR